MERHKLYAIRPRFIIGPQYRIITDKSIIFCKDGIVDIVDHGRENEYGVEEVFVRDSHVLLPGFIDAHTHTQQILLRGVITDEMLQLPPIWTELLIPFEKKLNFELAYLSSLLSIADMVNNGTVYFVEAGAPYPDALIRALLDTGMRGAVTISTYDKLSGEENSPEEIISIYNNLWRFREKGIDIWYSIREVMMCSPKLIKMIVEEALNKKTGLTYHIAEYQGEVDYTLSKYLLRPLELMDRLGATNVKPSIAAHGIYLSKEEIDIVIKKSINIAWCPTVDSLLMGNHWGPSFLNIVKDLYISLGSDGGAFTRLDLLGEARIARSLTKSQSVALRYDKAALKTTELYKMLTGHEGRIVGKDFSIKKGNKAYFITIDLRNLGQPVDYNIIDKLISFATSSDITDVVVDGVFLKKNNQLTTINIHDIRRRLEKYYSYIIDTINELLQNIMSRRQNILKQAK